MGEVGEIDSITIMMGHLDRRLSGGYISMRMGDQGGLGLGDMSQLMARVTLVVVGQRFGWVMIGPQRWTGGLLLRMRLLFDDVPDDVEGDPERSGEDGEGEEEMEG